VKEFVESRKEMEAILREINFGFLGMAVDGKPYVIPLNYAYVDGKLLFHCALEGKKLDHIASNPRVCFTVARQPGAVERHGEGDPCHMDCDSVVCYGTARVVDDLEERTAVLNAFNRAFRPEADAIPAERAARCAAIEITIAEMTGRRERSRQLDCWQYSFA
jgi:nitroimidazol reductase NimA-like FMN-containing flavoprotein (pyridoxamine 5'-phosphate oxidase superfamily)